jgi:hypothetical protein
VTHEVVADRGGVIDTVLAGRLEPGWQTLTMSVEGGEPAETRVFVVGRTSGSASSRTWTTPSW